MSTLNTAITGLLTAQRSLTTTGHNIANVNTPGFSRQVVGQSAQTPQFTGAGFIGSGVVVDSITRVHSEFLTTQLRNSTASNAENQVFYQLASRIDNMLANDQTGLSPSLLNFFNAVQDVADLPTSVSARQSLLSEAQTLTSSFQFLDSQMATLTDEVRVTIKENVAEINSLARSIADINERIVDGMNGDPGMQPNDLLDQRDELVRQLSEFVSVSTTAQGDGAVNVFTGNGFPIVLGKSTSTFSVNETYFGNFEVTMTSAFSTVNITDNLGGGNLGGLLKFQNDMLNPVRNSLGRLAIGLADAVNDQHALGLDLDGLPGQAIFNIGAAGVLPLGGAVNTVSAAITDPAALGNSDYSLVFNGGASYTLRRLSDNQTTAIDTGGTSPFTTTAVDGFTLTITAGATAGDEYIIRPAINGARDLGVLLSEPRKVAAAAPLRAGESVNANGLPDNSGSAAITQVNVSSSTGIPLAADISLTFDAANDRFVLSSPPGGTLAYNPATDSAGKQFTIAAAGNASFSISGVPADGDSFVIGNNTGANGDNRNALALSDLQTQNLLLNGTSTFQDTFGQMVADVGTRTRQAEISSLATGSLLNQAVEARESLSGVNLDEEAANLLKFQQAFQAAAQVISTADRLFQELLNAFR